ncbi:MAG: hypothetical protein Q9219_005883 [cf. Caloplaca sp. 3 TL-2023]
MVEWADQSRYSFLSTSDSSYNLDLLISRSHYNSSRIATRWKKVPQTAPLNNHSITSDVSSALLDIAIPNGSGNGAGDLLTCSVDARWAMGLYHGDAQDYAPTVDLLKPDLFYPTPEDIETGKLFVRSLKSGRSKNIDEAPWRHVQMNDDWLRALTPPVKSNDGSITALSLLLEDMSLPNSTNLPTMVAEWGYANVTDFAQWLNSTGFTEASYLEYSYYLPAIIEPVIAALVADGMSRVGAKAVWANQSILSAIRSHTDQTPDQILAGLSVSPDPTSAEQPGTQVNFTVTIAGLAYRLDSKSYRIAVIILITHALLATAHVIFVYVRPEFYNTWNSFPELVVLAARSDPRGPWNDSLDGRNDSDASTIKCNTRSLFRNVGLGVKRYRTLGTEVRIRGTDVSGTHWSAMEYGAKLDTRQNVVMLFGNDIGGFEWAGCKRLETNKTYE